MSVSFTEPLWCATCDAITTHVHLRDARYECCACGQTRTFHLAHDGLYGCGVTP